MGRSVGNLCMKTLTKLFIVSLLSVASAMGQDVLSGVSKDTRVTTPDKEKSSSLVRKEVPNQIIGKKFKFRGALIQIIKANNPLQLINPFAPAEYGSGYDNVVRHPIDGKATGISALSVEF